MKALLGLLFFCVLLATGSSLECESCINAGKTCTGEKIRCNSGDVCSVLVTGPETGPNTIAKNCMPKSECQKLKDNVGKIVPGQQAVTVLSIECNKASVSSGSIILSISLLLLLKTLLS